MAENTPRSIGSEFHWIPRDDGPGIALPAPAVFFSLGRHAIVSAAHKCLSPTGSLWLPSYFCSHTTSALNSAGIQTTYYFDHPLRSEPKWETVCPRPGDCVLFVNYFGVRAQKPFAAWQVKHPETPSIEDHSHDPCSSWALQSRAMFAMASLRKTIPIPDGGLLWSPIRQQLPTEPRPGSWNGPGLKLAAMVNKRDYLVAGQNDQLMYEWIREAQTRGDQILSEEPPSLISPWSYEYLRRGMSKRWRNQRADNVRLFIQLSKNLFTDKASPRLAFTDWPEGHCPFNPLLVFHDQQARNCCQQHLVASHVYAPIHWPNQPRTTPTDSSELHLLTIPLDARCSTEDVRHVVEVLARFVATGV